MPHENNKNFSFNYAPALNFSIKLHFVYNTPDLRSASYIISGFSVITKISGSSSRKSSGMGGAIPQYESGRLIKYFYFLLYIFKKIYLSAVTESIQKQLHGVQYFVK